jgi:hypothetical protein
MGRPGGEGLEGVVFTQPATASAGGRVHAVQHADQYNYIYRGKPPYRVEPFTVPGPVVMPSGLKGIPDWLLSARHQIAPLHLRRELDQLEAWRDDRSPGLSVVLVTAGGGKGTARLAAEFAERSADLGWSVARARHRSEVAPTVGGDQHLAVRPPGLLLVVDSAERWPLEDLITLVRQHRDAARDRLRILLFSIDTGPWWQGLAHQFAKLDVLDVRVIKRGALAKSRRYAGARPRARR